MKLSAGRFISLARNTAATDTPEEVQRAFESSEKFAVPKPNGLIQFWWKNLTSSKPDVGRIFNSYLNSEQQIGYGFVEE